ncbi:hypothetical protein HPG69_000869 [Diceros bicornis minor]|uniref:Ribosomal protein L15 n=1 Tax=Diceros bicornis minor TaxID=77932 RepID=A0A7J7E549_DICBM|nr:hypothetical protein HPG69_000869 [Diceros bicornis minor]
MGTYKYIQELWRKKQSNMMSFPNMMSFLLRVRCWRTASSASSLRSTGPDKLVQTGIQGHASYVIYWIHLHCGGCKCLVPMSATYSKPVPCGVNQLNLQSVLEEQSGRHCGVLSPEFLVVAHQTSLQAQEDVRADICRPQEPRPWKGPQVPPQFWWFSLCSVEKVQYSPASLLPLI